MTTNPGKIFEREFKDSIDKRGYYYLRLKDNAQTFSDATNIKFTSDNPYDCLMFVDNTLFCFELKSTKNTNLSFWSEKIGMTNFSAATGSMIKKHQVEGLQKANQYNGVVAGLVINFRNTNHTYFWNIKHFLRFTEETLKKSFNESDVIENSGICIPQQLKKVHYDYRIDNLVDMYVGCKI